MTAKADVMTINWWGEWRDASWGEGNPLDDGMKFRLLQWSFHHSEHSGLIAQTHRLIYRV